MNLLNKEVVHKSFGTGNVVGLTDSYVEISFQNGCKKFLFPDAFESFLTLTDKKAAESVNNILSEKEGVRRQQEMELESEQNRIKQEQMLKLKLEKILKSVKRHPESQVAFGCKQDEAKTALENWKICTGTVKSGINEGKPNKPIRANRNSACLITTRNPRSVETQRRIVGVYMADEKFVGQLCEDGVIPAHKKYRISLTEEESKQLLFWNYYINKKSPDKASWNTGVYRYFNNIWMAQILRDIVSVKEDPQEKEFAQQFLRHFCNLNAINEDNIPPAEGLLSKEK